MGKTRIPSLIRHPLGILLCSLLATAASAGGGTPSDRQPAWVEPDVDRPGSDFKILWLRAGAEACQEACAQNPRCRSYTYVRRGVSGRMEGCWLKNGVPLPVEDGCCVSGVKTEETISLLVQEAMLPGGKAEMTPIGPLELEEPPGPLPEEPAVETESMPVTGSGRRDFAGMNFASAPVRIEESAGNVLSGQGFPSVADTGTGRRAAAGVRFFATPPSSGSVGPGPEATGTGRKGNPQGHYLALPQSGKKPAPKVLPTGSAKRTIGGVEITGVPPKR